MKKLWSDEGWDHYVYWQTQDKKTLKKLNTLIKDIERGAGSGSDSGIGKPEPLTAGQSGWWSRRIDEKTASCTE
jgi:toxin YoeB